MLNPESGISMIEVLIAILILSIGVLGLANMQFLGLRNSQNSYQRTQAAALAYEMGDIMRENRAQAQASGFILTGTIPTAPSVDCKTSGCDAAQWAKYNIFNWYSKVNATLPLATAQISCASSCAQGNVHTVTIAWDETRSGSTNANYTLRFVP